MNLTKLALISAAAYIGINYFNRLKNTSAQLIIRPTKVSGIRVVSPSRLRLKMDFSVENPTANDFTVNRLIKLHQVQIFDRNGQQIGTAFPTVDAISLPAQGVIVLSAVPVEIHTPGKIINPLILTDLTNLSIQVQVEVLNTIINV